jgi:hypothetical protein
MRNPNRYWLALCFCGLIWSGGCAPASWQPRAFDGVALEPGRYLEKYYRSSNFEPAAAVYRLETFPLEQVDGFSLEQARTLFNEELFKAMTANGLKVNRQELAGSKVKPATEPEVPQANQAKSLIRPQASHKEPTPTLTLSGVVDRLVVASPAWRFFSGKGHAELRVSGEIRRGQEVVFAFQDEVIVNPPINPKHRPPLEADLIARLAIDRFTTNFLNELLLPPKNDTEAGIPATAPPNR